VIQIVAYVSNLGRPLRGQRNCLTECVLRLVGRLGLRHDQVSVRLGQGLLQLLELYRHRQSVDCLTTLLVAIKSLLDVSPDGDDATQP
jgi:hypothetical protein